MKELEFKKGRQQQFHLDISSKKEVFITLLGEAECDYDCVIELCYTLNESEAKKVYEELKKVFGYPTLEKIEKHLEKIASCVEFSMDENNNVFNIYSTN